MKKLFSFLLIFAALLSFSLPAFAEEAPDTDLLSCVGVSARIDGESNGLRTIYSMDLAKVAALEAAGYQVVRHVGCSDLRVDVAVVHPRYPQQYVMGLLLDGAAYADAGTTRDRELSHVDVLRSLGWHIRRVWALDWFDNRDKELRAILRELETLCDAEDAV